MKSRPVGVVVKAELAGIAPPKRVLPEKIRYEHGLISKVRSIQLAVRVLLEHIEVCDVELVSIIGVITKKPDAEIRIAEDEAAKIADKRLNYASNRSRIKERCVDYVADDPVKSRT